MSIPSLKPEEYLNLRIQSNHQCLLVEGPSDKALFDRFLTALYRVVRNLQPDLELPTVVVDSACDLLDAGVEGANGNRETVEKFCALLIDAQTSTPSGVADRVVGFVDREFRGFKIQKGMPLEDELSTHRISGRLVWSRGHSIENYLFDFEELQPFLSGQSNFAGFAKALNHFEAVFDSALRVACTLSLAALSVDNRIDFVESNIDALYFIVSDTEVDLNTMLWKPRLDAKAREKQIPSKVVERIIEEFQLWYEQIKDTDSSVVRWLCHGHIGFRVLLAVYSQCVSAIQREAPTQMPEMAGNTKQVPMAKHSKKSVPMLKLAIEDQEHMCTQIWIERVVLGRPDFPWSVVSMLNLPIPYDIDSSGSLLR